MYGMQNLSWVRKPELGRPRQLHSWQPSQTLWLAAGIHNWISQPQAWAPAEPAAFLYGCSSQLACRQACAGLICRLSFGARSREDPLIWLQVHNVEQDADAWSKWTLSATQS